MRQYLTLAEELFDEINKSFATVDTSFRDVESRYGIRNALPHISIPSIKSYGKFEDRRTYDDGEKVESYKNGKLHGEITYHDNRIPTEYWIDGRASDKQKWEAYKLEQENKKIHIIYLDNKPYEVTGSQLKQIKDSLNTILKINNK